MTTVRAELIKIGTLPAVRLTAVATWAATVLLAFVFAAAARRGEPLAADPVLAPLRYTQAGFVVLGVLTATSEYQGGQIRTTLTAVPRRLALQAAKALALILVTVPVAALSVAMSVAVAPGPLPRVVGAATVATAHLTLTALLASAVATLVRHTVAALAGLLGLYFIAGPILRDRTPYGTYLPDPAAVDQAHGTVVALAWTLVALGVATATFHRRDA